MRGDRLYLSITYVCEIDEAIAEPQQVADTFNKIKVLPKQVSNKKENI